LKAYLPNLAADLEKTTGGTRSGMQQEAAHPGATRAALERPRKCDKSHIFVTFW